MLNDKNLFSDCYLCMHCEIELYQTTFHSWPLKGSVWQRCCKCNLLTHCNWIENKESFSVLPEQPLEILGMDGYETIAKDGKIFVKPKWISVKDKLPDSKQVCLLYVDYPPSTTFNLLARPLDRSSIFIGGYSVFQSTFIEYHDQRTALKYVSHWMPLPSAPDTGEQ